MSAFGYDSLMEIYPDVEDEQRTPNGIDLRIGGLERIIDDHEFIGCMLDKKYHASTEKVNWTDVTAPDGKRYTKALVLEPKTLYRVQVMDHTHIPINALESYRLRSTFARNGIVLSAGYGDAGYNGNLEFLLDNRLNKPYYTEEGVRFAQMIMIELDKTPDQSYDGDYQNNKHRG
jgi:deoxycytidine triphosphate deaminase